MMEVAGRSHRGRVCDFSREGVSIRTPFVIPYRDEDSDEALHIRGGWPRRLAVAGSETVLDAKIMTTVSSGRPSDASCNDGVCAMRLPFTGSEEIPADTEILVVVNGFELRRDPRRAVEQIVAVRERIGPGVLLCVLGIAEPSTLSLYAYMGVDLFDDSLARAMGAEGIRLIPEGEMRVGTDATAANLADLEAECAKVGSFTMAGRLRELVDQRAPASPSSVALLRILDRVGYAYQEESCPTVGGRFACNTTQSLRRPDLARYRERLAETFAKPEHKRVLLLLPCSARKPYHTSRSHKAFASAIHTAPHDTLVQEVIVTSPLGAVPRELDVFYPANSYDIPVTGEWKCEEKEMIRRMLADIIAQGYDSIVCHLGDPELTDGLAEMEHTVVGDPVSPVSLRNLDEALRRVTAGMEPPGYYINRRESMRTVLAFQFGRAIADLILDDDTYATGKFPYWKLIREDAGDRSKKTQLGMLTPERGMVSLTLEGAAILAEAGAYVAEMTDFEIKGNLFAVGVVDADPRIRIGDEAVIVCNGEIRGVGVAMMSGREMIGLKRGIAVKVRHKVR